MADMIDSKLLQSEYYRLCEIFYAEYNRYNEHENSIAEEDIIWYSKGGTLSRGGYFPLDPTAHLSVTNVKRGRLYKKLPADNKYDYKYWVRGGKVIKTDEGNAESFSVYSPGEVYRVSYKMQWIDGERLIIPCYLSRADLSGGMVSGYSFGIVDGIDISGVPKLQFEYKRFIYSDNVISEILWYNNLRLCSVDSVSFGRLLGLVQGEEESCCPEISLAGRYVKAAPGSVVRMHRNDKGRFEVWAGENYVEGRGH